MFEIEFLDELLSHTGQVGKISRTAHGVTSVTSITTTTCFAVQGTFERSGDTQKTEHFDWSIVLPSTLVGIIDTDDPIQNVVDQDGNTIISYGVIRRLDRYDHWEAGLQLFIARVNRK